MEHEERLPPLGLSARYVIRQETSARAQRNGRNAPKADLWAKEAGGITVDGALDSVASGERTGRQCVSAFWGAGPRGCTSLTVGRSATQKRTSIFSSRTPLTRRGALALSSQTGHGIFSVPTILRLPSFFLRKWRLGKTLRCITPVRR